MWASGLLIVGSLLAVVVGDALVAQGQVSLSSTQQALAAAVTTQKALQTDVAGKAAPPVVVSQAESEGLVAATQVVYLPQVSLRVPLPVPTLAPEAAPSSAHVPASSAGSASNADPPPTSPPAPTTSSSSQTASTTAARR
ncbi:MAG: hypothetical protein ABSC90_07700 [Acidimicrobiales bacterium]|jgi:hypothetical protein